MALPRKVTQRPEESEDWAGPSPGLVGTAASGTWGDPVSSHTLRLPYSQGLRRKGCQVDSWGQESCR